MRGKSLCGGLVKKFSMAQNLDRPPTACSEPPSPGRDEAFTDLLLALAHKMGQDNPGELAFAASCNLSGKTSALDVLQELRRQGVFSPTSCAKLEELLRRINRHDLGDMVSSYANAYPDPPPGRRHTQDVEKGRSVARVPFKRSATDPPGLFRRQLSPEHDVVLEGVDSPQVLQEQTIEGNSELASGRVADRQLTSTPRGSVSQETSPDHEMFVASGKQRSPIARSNTRYQHSSAELLSMASPNNVANFSFNHSTPADTSFQSCGPTFDPSSQGSQEKYSQSSRSATVSREGSFHSLQSSVSQHSRASLKDKASQMAHLAIDLIAQVSQEQLSEEWYRSNSSYSLSSASSSARYTHSDTASVHSECGVVGVKPWNKKHSQSFHGSSRPLQRRKKRSPSVPVCRRDNTHGQTVTLPTPPSPAADEEISEVLPEEVDTVPDSYEDLTPTRITLRQKKGRANREQLETQCHSVISDATPRQSVIMDNAIHLRHSVISEATLTRHSTASDASVSGPGSPVYVKESHDVAEAVVDDREMLKPSSPFPKEKSLLRRKFSFLRSKSRTSLSPSFTWKVGREELMKPVWRHQSQFYITRPGKYELDANRGKLNPKLTFQLYPNGLFKDEEKAVTMAVRIMTHDKSPPLSPSSVLHLKLVVWSGEGREAVEVKRCPAITEKLSLSVFYVYSVITHKQLKNSNCKHFHLELEVSCSGIQRESLV